MEILGIHELDLKEHSRKHRIAVPSESIVQQHLGEEVDINTIVRRYGLTTELPFGYAAGVYADFTGVENYHDALELIDYTRQQFHTLPPEVRERFRNDPGIMVQEIQKYSPAELEALYAPAAVPSSVDAPKAPSSGAASAAAPT